MKSRNFVSLISTTHASDYACEPLGIAFFLKLIDWLTSWSVDSRGGKDLGSSRGTRRLTEASHVCPQRHLAMLKRNCDAPCVHRAIRAQQAGKFTYIQTGGQTNAGIGDRAAQNRPYDMWWSVISRPQVPENGTRPWRLGLHLACLNSRSDTQQGRAARSLHSRSPSGPHSITRNRA